MKEKNHLAQKTLFFSSYRGEDVCRWWNIRA